MTILFKYFFFHWQGRLEKEDFVLGLLRRKMKKKRYGAEGKNIYIFDFFLFIISLFSILHFIILKK